MDYAARVNQLRQQMEEQNVAGVFLPLDASMEYFVGAPRTEASNTPHRQNSAEYGCLLITGTDIVYLNSRLHSGDMVRNAATAYPLVTEVIPFPDVDLTGETFLTACQKLNLQGKKLAYLQDIRSTLVLRLLKDLSVSWVNFDPVIQGMRAIKDTEEQQLMAKAAAINDRIYETIFPQLQPGVAVAEIAREIDRLSVVFGAHCTSFTTAVYNLSLEENGKESYPVLKRGYILAYDYGVLYRGYCSDFGRTIFFGEPDEKAIQAHALIMAAQAEGIRALNAGQICGAEANKRARQVILDGGYDKEFGHRLGHGIGKDVHERPFLSEGEERILQSGMHFTVEPSLRLPQGIIRVEDVIMVTPDGGVNLNRTTHDLVVID